MTVNTYLESPEEPQQPFFSECSTFSFFLFSHSFDCFTGPGHRLKNTTSSSALRTNSDNSHKKDERQKQYSLATNSMFPALNGLLVNQFFPHMALCTAIQSHLLTVPSVHNCRSAFKHTCFGVIGYCCCQSSPAGCVTGHHQAHRGLVSCVDKECKYALYSI